MQNVGAHNLVEIDASVPKLSCTDVKILESSFNNNEGEGISYAGADIYL